MFYASGLGPNKGQNMSDKYQFTHWELSRSLPLDGWLTPDTYGKYFQKPTDISACYMFLCADVETIGFKGAGALVGYIGMSTQLATRWRGHEILREIPRDKFYTQRWFMPTPKENLRSTERKLIQKYNPPWNISGKVRGLL